MTVYVIYLFLHYTNANIIAYGEHALEGGGKVTFIYFFFVDQLNGP